MVFIIPELAVENGLKQHEDGHSGKDNHIAFHAYYLDLCVLRLERTYKETAKILFQAFIKGETVPLQIHNFSSRTGST